MRSNIGYGNYYKQQIGKVLLPITIITVRLLVIPILAYVAISWRYIMLVT